ncbi:MAG: hypothetical protein K6T78_06035 [Alicyclobacillus sp.]|nr:hypothetical protein [Alicyclobacillus sp.]
MNLLETLAAFAVLGLLGSCAMQSWAETAQVLHTVAVERAAVAAASDGAEQWAADGSVPSQVSTDTGTFQLFLTRSSPNPVPTATIVVKRAGMTVWELTLLDALDEN